MKLILNGQCLQVIIYWKSIKAALVALTSVLRFIALFITILLTLFVTLRVHRLLDMLGR